MYANKIRSLVSLSLSVLFISTALCGCGSAPQQAGAAGADGTGIDPAGVPGTLSSTIDDPDFGTYELVAQGGDQRSGKWNFLVRATRGGVKPQLRFVWDFGNGPEGEGTEQVHTFTADGSYLIKVSALQADGRVAFVLKLTLEVSVDPNQAPVAVAGPDQSANENDLVFLYGGDSTDPNGDAITYSWSQTFGPAVGILHAAEPSASFVAPLIDVDTDLVFRLTVDDGSLTGHDDIIVHAKPLFDPAGMDLQVSAGPDQQVAPGASITLSGSATPTNSGIVYAWNQFQGPSLTIANANLATASFVAPAVVPGATVVFGFELVATLQSAVATDEVLVTVVGDTLPGGGGGDPCAVDTDHDGVNDCVAGCSQTNCDQCPNDPRKGVPQQCGCGVADTDADGDATPDCHDACPNDPEKVAAGLCGCGNLETPNCSGGTGCVTSLTTWRNTPLAAQSGRFEVNFDATPSSSAMDGVIGFSRGSATTFSGFAVMVRFNPGGSIDARNGGSYAAATSIPYSAGILFHFRFVVDVLAKSYDVYVTRAGGPESALGLGYAFRTEQNTVASLDNWSAWADVGTTVNVCGFAISTPALSANAGADVTIAPGGSTPLSGSATGGTPPYTYRWSPTTGLNNANIAGPTATPSTTTTYSLTVTDAASATANDIVTVTVQATPLAASAGPDRQIVPGGSVALSGSATGGAPPYTYRWSPTTGLSNATIASPTASPGATTTYTLTVTDSQSRTANDSALVTVTTATAGNTYYVAKNATNASDTNPGTEASPWKTLAKAGNTARAGDTVDVKAGTYTETLQPVNSGTVGNLITFRAYPGHECQGAYGMPKTAGSCQVVIDGQSSRSSGVDLSRPVNYVRIEGFEIRNHTDDGIYVQAWGDCISTGAEIVNNFVHDNVGDGVDGRNGILIVIENNEIYANGLSAITFGGLCGGVNFVARANNIHYNGKDGIQGSGRGCVFDGNRIYNQFHTDAHQDAFDITTLIDSVISNNICYDLTQHIYGGPDDGSSGQSWDNVQIFGNILYTDKYWTQRGGEAPGIFIAAGQNSTSPVRNIYIHSNTFAWLGYPGIRIYGGSGMGRGPVSNIRIRNNLFVDASIDVSVGSTSEVTSNYNYFLSTVGNQTNTAAWVNEGPNSRSFTNVSESAWFVNYRRHVAFDLRLAPNSQARDAGDPNLGTVFTLPAVFKDLWGQLRPADIPGVGRDGTGAYDIGAYELPAN